MIGWFFATHEKPEAKAWLDGFGGALNVVGQRGYGKTLYTATLIDYLTQTSIGESVVSFAFCRNLTPSAIFKSLIWQICQRNSKNFQQKVQVLKAYEEFSFWESAQKPKEEQKDLVFRKIYEDMLRCYDRVILILDAVDQSISPDRLVRLILPLASRLFDSNTQFRVLMTSQQEIAWPRTTGEELSLTVLSITKEDLAIDITKFVRLCMGRMQSPLDKGEEPKMLTSCSKVTSSGWPYVMHKMAKEYLRCQQYKEAQNMEDAVLEYMQDRSSVDSKSTIEYKRILAVALSE